jgi:hypothetical protein
MALRKILASLLTDGSVNGTVITDGSIAAVDLSASAITDKLGYTPVSPTDLNDGLSTKQDTIGYIPVSPTDLEDTLATKITRTSSTGSALIPTGTTAQRDSTPESGLFRFNSDTDSFEGYNGSAWGAVGGGATGGAGNAVFYENDQTISVNYTITEGKNAMTAGPVTLADGVEVTIPDGTTWTIV